MSLWMRKKFTESLDQDNNKALSFMSERWIILNQAWFKSASISMYEVYLTTTNKLKYSSPFSIF